MKKSSIRQISLLLLCPALSACHFDGHVLMGGHSPSSSMYAASSCQSDLSPFSATSNSGSTAACQVPDEGVLVSAMPEADGSLHVVVRKTADGSFPFLSLSYQERSSSSPHSVNFTCGNSTSTAPSATPDLMEIVCVAQGNTHIRWYETSSQDVRVQLYNLQISDTSCGSSKSLLYQQSYCETNAGATSSTGSQIGSVTFPDLYLEGPSS